MRKKTGRTSNIHWIATHIRRFQSAPANKDGRTPSAASIAVFRYRFNPRPPIKTGEPGGNCAVADVSIDVSIRARQ